MNNFGQLLYTLNENERRVVRNLESVRRKQNNCHNAVMFNYMCLKENLLPIFSKIRLHDEALQRSRITSDFRRNLVKQQLDEKRKLQTTLRLEVDQALAEFNNLDLHDELKNKVMTGLDNIIANYFENGRFTTVKKLSKLYGGYLAVPKATDSFIKLSSRELSEEEKSFLNLELRHQLSLLPNV